MIKFFRRLKKIINILKKKILNEKENIEPIFPKILLLNNCGNYESLFKKFYKAGSKEGLESILFEICFAYDFEKRGHKLKYEVIASISSKKTIDFMCSFNQNTIYLELVRKELEATTTNDIKRQLEEYNSYSICLGGKSEKESKVRLINNLLDKYHKKEFMNLSFGNHNIIVVTVEELLLGMFDSHDCKQVLYGDPDVCEEFKIGLIGLFQTLGEENEFFSKFKPFQQNISGVVFVRRQKSKEMVIPDLEYLFISNNKFNDSILKELFVDFPTWKNNI